jgi:ankyrin repeat protein
VDGSPLMIKAAKKGNVEAVVALLDMNPELIHAKDADGSTPLHCAAWKGNDAVAALLIERGADLTVENENDHWGGTPLHAAAHANNRAIAEMLIRAGADVRFRSRNGRTPLEETQIHKATAVAKALIQATESA